MIVHYQFFKFSRTVFFKEKAEKEESNIHFTIFTKYNSNDSDYLLLNLCSYINNKLKRQWKFGTKNSNFKLIEILCNYLFSVPSLTQCQIFKALDDGKNMVFFLFYIKCFKF